MDFITCKCGVVCNADNPPCPIDTKTYVCENCYENWLNNPIKQLIARFKYFITLTFCRHKWICQGDIPTFDVGDVFTPDNPTKFKTIYYCEKCNKTKTIRQGEQ